MRVRYLLAALVAAFAVVTPLKAVTLSSAGSDFDVGFAPGPNFFPGGEPPYVVVTWRSNGDSKPLDIDGDNVYGSGGYAMFATDFEWPYFTNGAGSGVPFADDTTYQNLVELPSFVTNTANLTANKVGGWNYALVDDPRLVNGYRDYNWGDTQSPTIEEIGKPLHSQSPYVKIGIVDGNDVLGNNPRTAEFGAARWGFEVGAGVPSTFRVGVMTDGLDGSNWAATEVFLAKVTLDPVPAIVGTPVSSGEFVGFDSPNRFVDMHFFDVVDAQPGDQFAIFAKASPDGFGAISAVTFDFIPSPVQAGDFNGNGIVDLADYTVWRDNLGADEAVLNGAGDGSTIVDTGDYDTWKANFGAGSPEALVGAPIHVPEPTTLVLLLLGSALVARVRRRNR
jgi:hypothetical protein